MADITTKKKINEQIVTKTEKINIALNEIKLKKEDFRVNK